MFSLCVLTGCAPCVYWLTGGGRSGRDRHGDRAEQDRPAGRGRRAAVSNVSMATVLLSTSRFLGNYVAKSTAVRICGTVLNDGWSIHFKVGGPSTKLMCVCVCVCERGARAPHLSPRCKGGNVVPGAARACACVCVCVCVSLTRRIIAGRRRIPWRCVCVSVCVRVCVVCSTGLTAGPSRCREETESLAKSFNLRYFRTSVKDNVNIDEGASRVQGRSPRIRASSQEGEGGGRGSLMAGGRAIRARDMT